MPSNKNVLQIKDSLRGSFYIIYKRVMISGIYIAKVNVQGYQEIYYTTQAYLILIDDRNRLYSIISVVYMYSIL